MGAWRRTSIRVCRAVCAASVALIVASCGSSAHHSGSAATTSGSPTQTLTITVRAAAITAPPATTTPPAPQPANPRRSPLIAILPAASREGLFGWTPAIAIRGTPGVWISRAQAYREPGFTITLLRFDPSLVTLALHAGGSQPGGTGWRFGDAIRGAEARIVLAAFNSAFQESYGAGGFEADGRVGWPLRPGDASVVIYKNGAVDIGAWKKTVPARGRAVEAVRQNLQLLINDGRIASTVDTCIKACWGDPLHEQPIVARSALGITAGGDLVWAAGHNLSVRALAEALAGKGVERAMELDINPSWVAGYAYTHPPHALAPTPIPLVPGQNGIPGQFLQPYFRDFFTVIIRR